MWAGDTYTGDMCTGDMCAGDTDATPLHRCLSLETVWIVTEKLHQASSK